MQKALFPSVAVQHTLNLRDSRVYDTIVEDGKSKWALSTYQANTALIANYITPLIGSMKLQDITTRVIEGYYQRLLKYEAADQIGRAHV